MSIFRDYLTPEGLERYREDMRRLRLREEEAEERAVEEAIPVYKKLKAEYNKLLKMYKELKEQEEKEVEARQIVKNIDVFKKMKDEAKGECISFAAMYSENISLGKEVLELKRQRMKLNEEINRLKGQELGQLYEQIKACMEWIDKKGYK